MKRAATGKTASPSVSPQNSAEINKPADQLNLESLPLAMGSK